MVRLQRPVLEQRDRVEDRRAAVFGIADQDADAARRLAHPRELFLDLVAKAAMEQQVFGRISRQREFRQHEQVDAGLRARLCDQVEHAAGIARDVADQEIGLRQRDRQTR